MLKNFDKEGEENAIEKEKFLLILFIILYRCYDT